MNFDEDIFVGLPKKVLGQKLENLDNECFPSKIGGTPVKLIYPSTHSPK
jgi:hypothetical protein